MTRRADFALVALAGVLWGTGGLAGAALGETADLTPMTVASFRLLGGGLLLAVVVGALGRLRRYPRSRGALLRTGGTALLIALFEAAYFEAVDRSGVAVATLVTLGAAPVLVAAATAAVRRRRPDARTLVALVLALVGLVALVTAGAEPGSGGGTDPGTGVLLALLAAAAFAALTAVNTVHVEGLDPLASTAVSFTIGGVLLLPFAAAPAGILNGGIVLPHDAHGWALLVYLAAVPTATAYAAYFTGLRTVSATHATLLALLEPLTAALGAVLLRGERLGPVGVLGGLLLVAAVVTLRPRTVTSPTMVGPGDAAGHVEQPASSFGPMVPGRHHQES
ncbi:DMT family transporter [Cellulomonas composti]|uniref:EamA domain-containing protein n=1 Tax=Cellulomonas composti TaxID=266130 RepID=A0A511JAX1_9CELL|nr:EamA family transporter [Cellulomonas composti]GEL95132.1 hypothetical protein CCO02nite_17900 [Cellulomonas composti]